MEIAPSRSLAPRRGLFTTFYSFKGGVGRTMALLNVAAILARLGRKVLMVDFDLEAPGLTLFQHRQPGEAGHPQRGLVDALADFLDDPGRSPLGSDDPAAFFDAYVTPLPLPEAKGAPSMEGGRLDLLPAGRLDRDYERKLYRLPFKDLFKSGVGLPLFERLRSVIKGSDRYDYVFVDSRTGFSDEGSICTRYLADDLVVVTGLNHQNVEGTARFLRQSGLAAREGRPQRVGFVASPVPAYYEDKTAARKDEVLREFAEAGFSDVRFIAEIPYHPILALEEDPRLNDLSGTPLYAEYQRIEARVRAWSNDDPQTRMDWALDRLRRGEAAEALPLIRELAQEAPELLGRQLRFEIRRLEDRSAPELVPILEAWYAAARAEGDALGEMRALWELADLAYDRGDANESVRHYKQVLALAREIGDRRVEGIRLIGLANRLSDLRRAEEAVGLYEEALAIAREVGDRQSEGIALGNLGIARALLGQDSEAREALAEALDVAGTLGHPPVMAGIQTDEVEALALLAPDEALSRADDIWDTVMRDASAFERARLQVLRARLRAAHGDPAGAIDDAEAALALYRPNGVDSIWSREAEAIVKEHGPEA